VPGGFGHRGAEGKIRAVQFARERKVPYFGICFGMQMAVVEGARNLAGINSANSTEFGATQEPVVGRIRPSSARRKSRWSDFLPNGCGATSASGARRAETSAAPCGLAPIRLASRKAAASRKFTARPRFRSATGIATRSTPSIVRSSKKKECASQACRRTAYCRRSSNTRIIRGSSACNSIPN